MIRAAGQLLLPGTSTTTSSSTMTGLRVRSEGPTPPTASATAQLCGPRSGSRVPGYPRAGTRGTREPGYRSTSSHVVLLLVVPGSHRVCIGIQVLVQP
eukprot:40332-Rhodomonas_salina.2